MHIGTHLFFAGESTRSVDMVEAYEAAPAVDRLRTEGRGNVATFLRRWSGEGAMSG